MRMLRLGAGAILGAAVLACGASGVAGTGSSAATGGNGSAQVVVLATDPTGPTAIAVDASNVYWVDGTQDSNGATQGRVMKVPLAGGTPTVLATGGYMTGVAVDANYVYFADGGDLSVSGSGGGGSIGRVPIAGGAVVHLATNVPVPEAVMVDGSFVYWTNQQALEGVFAVPKGGGTVRVLSGCNQTFTNPGCASWQGGVPSGGLTQDATNVYWADGSTVWAVPKVGGAVRVIGSTTLDFASVAVAGTKVYWTTYVSLMAGSTSGGGAQTVVDGLYEPCCLVTDGAEIFYGIESAVQGAPFIGRVSSSGASSQLQAGHADPFAIAVDATHVYWVGYLDSQVGVFKVAR